MTSILTRTISRLLLLPSLMIAAAILVKGYADAGDGFNAGVVAALGILLQYLAFGYRRAERLLPMRFAPQIALSGLLLALAVCFVPVLYGEAIFTHSPAPGAEVIHIGTLELITAVVFDLAVFLLVFGAAVAAMRFVARVLDTDLDRPASAIAAIASGVELADQPVDEGEGP